MNKVFKAQKEQIASSVVYTILKTLDEKEQSNFSEMLNGTATNQLTSINTNSNPPKVDDVTGDATIEQGTLKVFINDYNKLTGGLRTSTAKLLDVCTLVLSHQNNYKETDLNKLNKVVTIPLEEYMALCGIPDTKASKDKTRRKVNEDLDTLYHISMEWTENSGKKTKDFAKMRLCDNVAIRKGNIIFSFTQDMAKYLTNSYVMHYPLDILKLDERNANSYHIGKKLLLHNSIDNNRTKGTANILSVKSLLAVCPDIPTYEEVSKSDRHLEQRIKLPLELALNSLNFIKWEYCNSKGTPLTEEQLQATDYNCFINLFIKFDVIGVPDQTARLERKAKRAESGNIKGTTKKKK